MGMLEKLYQDVWAQVYAATWAGLRDAARDGLINPEMRPVYARGEADQAAASALESWDRGKQAMAMERFVTLRPRTVEDT